MNIFDVIHQYREGIERSEVGMLRDLARLWVPSYRYLKQQVKDLMTVIQAQRDRGEPVWIGYLHSMERYQSMMEQARRTIDAYNRAALGRISGEEADAVEIGSETARKLVNIAAANDPLWIRVNKREGRILSGMLSEMSPLRALLDKSWPETSRKLDEVLTVGLTTGQGSNWIAQRMMEAVTIPEKRALLIARTEVNRTYREANLETMRESRAVIGYRRMCYPPTACFACLEMDGEFYEKGESFSDHPNGKCSAVPVTKHFDPINDPNWERGQDWFLKQSPETQRKIMGPGRYEAWKAGEIENLRDLVRIKPNELWGGSPTVISLQELNLATATERRMFHEYSDLMGDYLPTRYLYDFVEAKHNNDIGWARIQFDYDFIKKYGANSENPPLINHEKAYNIMPKLMTYALNPNHERGQHKALVFNSALGYNANNAELLEIELRKELPLFRATSRGNSGYGEKFDVKLLLNGVNGNRQPVTTGWQYDTDTKEPRLLTIYVDENKRR